MFDQNNIVSVSLYDVARSLRVEPNKLKQSFERFLEAVPDARDHIDAVEEITRGGFGGRCLTYRVDTVALMAFLYWREHHGRLPRFFGVQSRVIEGGASNGR